MATDAPTRSEDVIARRTLVEEETGAELELQISRPELSTEYEDTWRCDVVAHRDGAVAFQYAAHGVDSLQALINALAVLRRSVASLGGGRGVRVFSWNSAPGAVGLPCLVQDEGPDFVEMIEHLVAAEMSRRLMLTRRPPNY